MIEPCLIEINDNLDASGDGRAELARQQRRQAEHGELLGDHHGYGWRRACCSPSLRPQSTAAAHCYSFSHSLAQEAIFCFTII